MVSLVRIYPLVAPKHQTDQAKHVESSQTCGNQTRDANDGMPVRPGRPENLVLAEEPRERKDSADGQGADDHGPMSDRNMSTQPTHTQQVLFSAHGMDDAACAEEEESLEESVGH